MQRFVAFDPDQHYLTMRRDRADEFRRIALFDMVANNADRKSGHCLLAGTGGSSWSTTASASTSSPSSGR